MEQNDGSWVEAVVPTSIADAKTSLYTRTPHKAMENQKLAAWELKRDRDAAIRQAANLQKEVYPEFEFEKSMKEYSERCAAATRQYLLDSGASLGLLGRKGPDPKEAGKVHESRE